MKKFCVLLGVMITILVMFVGCEKTPSTNSTKDFTIEIEDSYGNKCTLSKTDLYYRFYASAQASGVLVYGWENPSDIRSEFLTNFFVNHTNWIHTDAEIIILPQEAVEEYLGRYFDVQPNHLRKSTHYRQEQEGYELPLVSMESSVITSAVTQGNLLTISYETYYYSPETKEDTIARQGHVTIEMRSYPGSFQYISNVITYDAEE